MKKLLLKILIILVVVFGTIYYLDSSNLFSFNKDHVEQRWEGLYKFTEDNEIDVLLLGNSRTYCGINPKTMSSALGANSFVLATPNGSLTQAYYNLREALTVSNPKLVAIEVSTLNTSSMSEKEGSGKSFLYKDFAARKNILEKIITTPNWFELEDYPFAWSTSIRNHNFIFTNTEQLKKNYEKSKKSVANKKLYLGRYVRFTSGIEDSILNKYKTDGPAVDGQELTISDEQMNSLKLITDLLKEKNIKVVFFTVPVYKEHIKNYQTRFELIANLIEDKYGYELFDFQKYYIEKQLGPECFENTYGNQHMTYNGSLIITYNLADSILNSELSEALPNRKSDQLWHNVFYGQENYFFNNTLVKGGKVLFTQANITTNKCTIKELGVIQEEKFHTIVAKIPKDCIPFEEVDSYQIQMLVDIKVNGQLQRTRILLPYNKYQIPFDSHIFSLNVKKIEFVQIQQVNIVDTKSIQNNAVSMTNGQQ